MITHDLKCWPDSYSRIADGTKSAEYRREDDRRFEAGDSLRLREWHPSRRRYTGQECTVRVTHVLRGPAFDVPEGFVVLSITFAGAR